MLPDTFITYTHTCRPSHSSAAGDGCPTEPNSWDDRIIIIFNVGKMYLAIKVILLLLYHGCETAACSQIGILYTRAEMVVQIIDLFTENEATIDILLHYLSKTRQK